MCWQDPSLSDPVCNASEQEQNAGEWILCAVTCWSSQWWWRVWLYVIISTEAASSKFHLHTFLEQIMSCFLHSLGQLSLPQIPSLVVKRVSSFSLASTAWLRRVYSAKTSPHPIHPTLNQLYSGTSKHSLCLTPDLSKTRFFLSSANYVSHLSASGQVGWSAPRASIFINI